MKETVKKEAAQPSIVILIASPTDRPIIKEAEKILDEFHTPYELKTLSAHRTPQELFEYLHDIETHRMHIKVIIAAAGGAAHLPGMAQAYVTIPVIGVPVPSTDLKGIDALLSIVQMPRGVPVATVAIGAGANAAILALEILGAHDPILRQKIKAYRLKEKEKILKEP